MPHAAAERTLTGAALDAPDLTIVTAWSDAIAEALEHAPERVDELIDDARPGTPWRRSSGCRSPRRRWPGRSPPSPTSSGRWPPGGTAPATPRSWRRCRRRPPTGTPPVSLARAVLRSALEARQDARAVVSRHG